MDSSGGRMRQQGPTTGEINHDDDSRSRLQHHGSNINIPLADESKSLCAMTTTITTSQLGVGDKTSMAETTTASTTTISREGWVPLKDDIYNLFFLSKTCSTAFWYAIYIFLLKMSIYTFLAYEEKEYMQEYNQNQQNNETKTSIRVLMTQFLLIPIAIAMQEDLMGSFYIISNIKYTSYIQKENPDATKWKFHVANLCRAIDGLYSLCVNFVILLFARKVLTALLNFAALQFLQHIDNMALQLCIDGYLLSNKVQHVACQVIITKLPKKNKKCYQYINSILFFTLLVILFITWAIFIFG